VAFLSPGCQPCEMLAGDLATAAADGRLEAHASAAWVVTAPYVRELPSQTTWRCLRRGRSAHRWRSGGVALDVWSSVASTRWDFGDGTAADGKSVSHGYSAPGSYEVTVSSTDSLNNVSSEKRTVAITAAPAGAPSPARRARPARGPGASGGSRRERRLRARSS
jgi:hypothetical protein